MLPRLNGKLRFMFLLDRHPVLTYTDITTFNIQYINENEGSVVYITFVFLFFYNNNIIYNTQEIELALFKLPSTAQEFEVFMSTTTNQFTQIRKDFF